MSRCIFYILTSVFASVVDGLQVSVRVGSDVHTEHGQGGVRPDPQTPSTDSRDDPHDGEFVELPQQIVERLQSFEEWLRTNPDFLQTLANFVSTCPDWHDIQEEFEFYAHASRLVRIQVPDWARERPDLCVTVLKWTRTHPDWYDDLKLVPNQALAAIAEIHTMQHECIF